MQIKLQRVYIRSSRLRTQADAYVRRLNINARGGNSPVLTRGYREMNGNGFTVPRLTPLIIN